METPRTQGSSNQSPLPRQGIAWHQLWLVRVAIIAITIITLGFTTSVIIAIHGIESITKMAFDPNVEEIMDNHLDTLKRAHHFRKETFVARLARVMPQVYRRGEAPIQQFMIEKWIDEAKITEYMPADRIAIQEIPPQRLQDYPREAITWLDSSTIKIRNFSIALPKDLIRAEFEKAEDVLLRHRGIRANWNSEIKPTLLKLIVMVVMATILIVIASLAFIFRRFKNQINRLVHGFNQWSAEEAEFRFNESWTGELEFISAHFNLMADEVATNRNRRMYLEKVASWQIIARKLAHEIKNPLTPIQMMVTQLVRRYKGEDPEFKSLLEDAKNIISEEVTSLRRMVDSFSKFAQMPQPKVQDVNLLETIHHATELEKAAFPDKTISFESPITEAIARFDDQLIRQVLINLIKNAAEASGDKPVTIKVALEESNKNYTVKVCDDGPGIPEELQSRIFEAYFTTKHTGPSPGMGLGLAVCQKVMLEHGGDLKVSSRPGKTCFELVLPRG